MPKTAAQIKRITWLALAVNALLSAAKLSAGAVANSQAVLADGVHSLSDMASDIALLVGVRYWVQPSDKNHPYGHGRIETLITWCMGILLGATGLGLGYRAFSTLTAVHRTSPGALALAAALLSIVCKEALYHITVAVGKKVRSSALVANAWHHRSDALSSIPTALAVGGAMLSPRWQLLDHVGAMFVCVLILHAAWRIIVPASRELVDAAPSAELRDAIMETITGFPQVEVAHALRLRYFGAKVAMDFHIQVRPDMTVKEGHDVAEDLKVRLLVEFPDVHDVVIHIEPTKS